MSSLSEQDPLNPNDPSYHASRWLRERAKAGLSSSHETIPEPVRSPIAAPASLDIQLKNAVSNALNPLDPDVIHEPAGLARELDRRAALHSVAARFAAAAGVVTVVAVFFFIVLPASRQSGASSTFSEIIGSVRTTPPQPGQEDGGSKPMAPASRQSDAGSTSSKITGSLGTPLPQSGQRDGGSKPALAEFQAILAPAPASQPATHEQSQQLLQQFLQWRQKAISTETSQ